MDASEERRKEAEPEQNEFYQRVCQTEFWQASETDTRRYPMSEKRSMRIYLGLFFFLLTVCLTSFGGVSAAGKEEILVGAISSLTGANAMTGAEQRWAYEQAVADINKKGGVYVKEFGKKLPIKLIYADDKSAADQAAAAMERLIKMDKIDLAMSSNVLPINVAAATVCEKYKVYFAMTCTWLDKVADQNFKWASDFFYTGKSAAEVPFLTWKTLPEADAIKRPAMMMEDDVNGQGFGASIKNWAKEYGVTFVMDEPYAVGSKDFSAHILKMKAAKADALLYFGSPTDGITLLRQMKEQQLKLRYIHGWKGFWPTEFVRAMGNDADYVIHDGFWTENSGAPGAKELGQRFKNQFKTDSVSIGLYYANPQALAMAIEKAGSINSAKVRDAVFGGEFKGTVKGDLKFNEKGLCFVPSHALQWWKGERMPVYPPAPSIWNLKLKPVD
jgi:branched-chain amino acid transport system substrate-binding protein